MQRVRRLPSAKYLRECFEYNPRTGKLVWAARPRKHFKTDAAWKRFQTMYAGKQAGHEILMSGKPYVFVSPSRVPYLAHRVAWKIHYGVEPGPLLDHRDGNGLNNRIRNLRDATASQNQYNAVIRKDNSTGVKGVSFKDGRYHAAFRTRGKRTNVGSFGSLSEASRALTKARKSAHGEFARAA
jgi:hypothetical protein